ELDRFCEQMELIAKKGLPAWSSAHPALPLPLSLLKVTAAVSGSGYSRRSAVGDHRYSIASVAIAETVRRLLCVRNDEELRPARPPLQRYPVTTIRRSPRRAPLQSTRSSSCSRLFW